MRIAMPIENDNGMESNIFAHFGEAPYLAVYDTDSKKLKVQKRDSTHECGRCAVVEEIMKLKPDLIFAKAMGFGAMNKCANHGAKVVTGDQKTISEVIKDVSALKPLQGGCIGHHGGSHDCH